MEQGTESWHQLRKRKIGASDAPTIMGVSPWSTPYQLWKEKTGKNSKPEAEKQKGASLNWAIERGVRWEPMARARYELHNDIPMEPTVVVHPELDFLMASLDGWNAEARRALEIKIPGKEVFELAKRGIVHEKYVWQLEHQLLVSQGDENHFYCCKVETKNGREQITDDALVIYKSDPERREQLIPKLHEFWGFVTRNQPPPLSEKDVLVLEDINAKAIFGKLGDALLDLEEAETVLEQAEAKVVELKKRCDHFVTHSRVRCMNVQIQRKKSNFNPNETFLSAKLVG